MSKKKGDPFRYQDYSLGRKEGIEDYKKKEKEDKKEYSKIAKKLTSGGGARKSYTSGFATQKIRKVI